MLVTQIKEQMYAQYAKAQEWSKYLQPYFDAFNQVMNLDLDKIQHTLFQVPLSCFDGGDLSNVDKKWKENFEQVTTNNIYSEQNDYDLYM